MSVNLVCVDPKLVHEFWPHAKHLIKSAIDRTGLSDFADIEYDVLCGDQLLWLAWDGKSIEAAATTHLVVTSGTKVCILTACAGQHREQWMPLFEQIEQYAKNEKCSCVRIFGRRGWERVLSGYRVEHIIMEKAL